MTDLVTIDDLKTYNKKALREITVVNRIENLLEDMNHAPTSLKATVYMGDSGRRTHIFHASMIGGLSGRTLDGKYPMGCGRQLYYSYIGAPSEGAFEPKFRRILDTGTALHGQLQAYMHEVAKRSEGELTFADEVDMHPGINSVADQYDISGHTDGIIEILAKWKVRHMLEIKTINTVGYAKTNGAHDEHIMQATVYMACMDIPAMLFLYYNKNDSSMAEFLEIFSQRRWDAICKKLDHIRELAIREELPEREVSYNCNYCRWKGICKPPKRARGAGVTKVFQIRRNK